jgi:hypothetical protein
MKNKLFLTTLFATLGLTGIVNAQTTASGSLGVSATIVGSINLSFTTASGGFPVTGTGTATASLALGSMQMYGGTVPSTVSRVLTGITAFTLSTPVNVEVDLANQSSPNYSLLANLSSADTVNTWTFAGNAVTALGLTPQVSSGTYGSASPYTFAVTVPAGNNTGSLSNTLSFTATAN